VLHGGLNVVPASDGFDGAECLDLAAHWRNASFFAAPTMVRRFVEAARARPRRPDGLATIVHGGGPMYLADIEAALRAAGPHFAQICGQGEHPMTITVLPRWVIDDAAQPRHAPRVRLARRGESPRRGPRFLPRRRLCGRGAVDGGAVDPRCRGPRARRRRARRNLRARPRWR
jgi:long-chain acyl-CoA synthetase